MTGFNTQIGGGLYRIQIETDRLEVFNVIQDMARAFVDTERTQKVDAPPKKATPCSEKLVGADA